jgi:hypothetical protein
VFIFFMLFFHGIDAQIYMWLHVYICIYIYVFFNVFQYFPWLSCILL